MLYKTGIVLELVSDSKIYSMIEEQKRGGLCVVGSKRYARANNPYLGKDYDETKENSYIPYWDMNNIYGCAMIDLLPTGGHRLLEEYDINEILQTPDDSSTGYLLRVDIIFPEDKHDVFKQYPPAPENTSPTKRMVD